MAAGVLRRASGGRLQRLRPAPGRKTATGPTDAGKETGRRRTVAGGRAAGRGPSGAVGVGADGSVPLRAVVADDEPVRADEGLALRIARRRSLRPGAGVRRAEGCEGRRGPAT